MEELLSRTTVVFSHPFTVPGFEETLPAGDYEVETEISAPPDRIDPEHWKASVLVHLHARKTHPGLARTLTVSLADLESAQARDKLSGKELSQFFIDEMLADPMVRLVMQADGVSEDHIRHLYSSPRSSVAAGGRQRRKRLPSLRSGTESSSIQVAENEGWPTGSDPAGRQ